MKLTQGQIEALAGLSAALGGRAMTISPHEEIDGSGFSQAWYWVQPQDWSGEFLLTDKAVTGTGTRDES